MASRISRRAAFWRQHIAKYQASGESRVEYCRRHGLKVHQLAYQVGLHNKATPEEQSSFAQVVLADAPQAARRSGARLVVGSDVAIEFDSGTDPAWVARLVAAVGGRP